MSKASKPKSTIDKNLLSLIAAATAAGSFHYVSQAEGVPLLQHNPPLIEVNTEMVQDGKAAARATAAGMEMAQKPGQTAVQPSNGSTSPYQLMKGVAVPASKRGAGLRGGAPKQYPFDTMEIGDSFFVPVSEKHPDPVKKLGSTVSSANMRYAEETGEMKTVTRGVRGSDHKIKLDATGAKVMETVEIAVHKLTRKFVIRPIEAGKQYGNWTADQSGALIARVELKE